MYRPVSLLTDQYYPVAVEVPVGDTLVYSKALSRARKTTNQTKSLGRGKRGARLVPLSQLQLYDFLFHPCQAEKVECSKTLNLR